MKKLQVKLEEIRKSNGPGFMMHIIAGYPDLNSSLEIGRQLIENGADILEVQIPFSDPVADGPIIASANDQALKSGVTVESSLDMIELLARETEAPILIMTYFNIVHHYGVEAFTEKAREIGVQGVIIPDYPFDEDADNRLIESCRAEDLAFVQVLASTTRPDRVKAILEHASGFVYCMARTGTTGKKTEINAETVEYLSRVKEQCDLPMAVGFGLSDRSQVEALDPHADIMVVGSALIKTYSDKPLAEGLIAVKSFMSDLL